LLGRLTKEHKQSLCHRPILHLHKRMWKYEIIFKNFRDQFSSIPLSGVSLQKTPSSSLPPSEACMLLLTVLWFSTKVVC
jgi:hypothetical protein